MNRFIYSVIGDTRLREVIGAYLLASVTGSDLMKSVGLNVDNGSWRNTFDFQIKLF